MKPTAHHKTSKKWVTAFPLLLASSSFHGLVFMAMVFIGVNSPGAGNSDGGEGNAFSVTWLPSVSQGGGRSVDTIIGDAESGDSLNAGTASNSPLAVKQRPLITVSHINPETVFDPDLADPLEIEPEISTTSTSGRSQQKDTPRRIHVNGADAQPTIDSGGEPQEPSVANNSTSTSSPESQSTKASSGNGVGLDREGMGGKGRNGEQGGGGATGGGGNQIHFFGIPSQAKRVVYVIDASESMRRHRAMTRAQEELWQSLKGLPLTAHFQVVFFNLTTHTMNRTGERLKLLPATSNNLRLAKQFVDAIQPDSGTDRYAAITQAMSLDTDVIYLLTDADEPELSAKELFDIHRNNKRKAAIHVIEFGIGSDLSKDSFLKKLARQNGGKHFYVDLTKVEK